MQYSITSVENIPFSGHFNLFAIICAVGFITAVIIVLIIILSMNRHSAKYYTHEDQRCGKRQFIFRLKSFWLICTNSNIRNHIDFADGLYEKNIDTLSITGNELNYKFPIDDIIYTLDETTLQPTQPTLITTFTTRNG